MVLFPRNYPPFYHFLLAGLSGIFSLDIARLMVFMAAVNVSLTGMAIFGIVRLLTKKNLPALISGLFYLSSSTIWLYLLEYGLYSRVFAQMMLSFAILALVFYFRRVEIQGKHSIRHAELISASKGILKQVQDDKQTGEGGWPYYLVVFSFALVFLSHFLTSVLLILAFLILLLFLFPRRFDRILLILKI
ncbi:MAG: hypothetical protein Q8P44_03065, partial [Dehalococcoidia bacterium]|nr:hypothetical protein [Dehalococcoidia bacterium]